MRILIYHMRFHPDLTGTAPLVTQLAVDLASHKNQVTVITTLPHYGRKDVHPDFRKKTGIFHDAMYQGVRVIRTPVFIPSRPKIYLRVLNYLSYTFFSVLAGFRAGKVDVVMAVNPPITTAFSAWLPALWYRVPLVLGIQDVWPEVVIRVGQLRNRLIIWLSTLLERFQYRIAKRVIVLSDSMKKNLQSKGVDAGKIAVISNWASLDTVNPVRDGKLFRTANNLGSRFVVLFAGNLGYVASLNYVIDAAEILKERLEFLFLFVGEGSVKEDLIKRSRAAGLQNVIFLTTQPDEIMPDMLSTADVGLVVLDNALGQLSVPSKTYTLMAAGKAILASVPEDSEVKRLIDVSGCGYWVPAQNPEKLAEAVIAMSEERNLLPEIGKKGRLYLEKRLTRETQTNAYLRQLKEVDKISGKKPGLP